MIKLFRLLFTIFVVAHWIACFFHLLAAERSQYTYTWLHDSKLLNESNFEKYVASLYWSITTMTTVGYGDIGPVSGVERLFTIVAMVIACALFGYSLNLVG